MSTRGSYYNFAGVLARLATHGNTVLTTKYRAQATTDSYWTRDYGPWWTIRLSDVGRIADGIGDFVYDRPRQNDNGIGPQMAASFDVQYALSDLLLSGGNMMVDGLGFAAATVRLTDSPRVCCTLPG